MRPKGEPARQEQKAAMATDKIKLVNLLVGHGRAVIACLAKHKRLRQSLEEHGQLRAPGRSKHPHKERNGTANGGIPLLFLSGTARKKYLRQFRSGIPRAMVSNDICMEHTTYNAISLDC